jgi:hypothetical protein
MEVSGGASPAELAALGAAIEVLLHEGTVIRADSAPPVYRSRWRQASLQEGVDGSQPDHHRPIWGTT